jgi:hypothetical protein
LDEETDIRKEKENGFEIIADYAKKNGRTEPPILRH